MKRITPSRRAQPASTVAKSGRVVDHGGMDRRALGVVLLAVVGCHEPSGSTTGAPTDGDADAGAMDDAGPPGPGAARVLYYSSVPGEALSEWFAVDCGAATPGPPVRVHALQPGTSIVHAQVPVVSRSRRWLGFTVRGPDVEDEQWFVRIDGPKLGAPARVNLPPQAGFTRPVFAPDEQQVAFGAVDAAMREALYLCPLADDGGCAAIEWSPPLAPSGTIDSSEVVFSIDGSKLAYQGDPDGDGTFSMFLARTGSGDQGKFAEVVAPTAGPGATYARFAPHGRTLYVVSAGDMNEQVMALDLTVDPPGSPVVVLAQQAGDHSSFREDAAALLIHRGGDLFAVMLDGTNAGPQLQLDAADHVVRTSYSRFVRDQPRVYYVAASEGADTEDLYLVDVGPQPPQPVRLNVPVDIGDGVDEVVLSADGSRLFFTVRAGEKNHHTLWMAPIAPVGPAVELSAPMAPSQYLPLDLAISGDLARVAYETQPVWPGPGDRYLVELTGPSAPMVLPRPSGLPWAYNDTFSPDGRRLFFATDANRGGPAYLVDVVPTIGAAVQISDNAHAVHHLVVAPIDG